MPFHLYFAQKQVLLEEIICRKGSYCFLLILKIVKTFSILKV